jgi:hypothetical protein
MFQQDAESPTASQNRGQSAEQPVENGHGEDRATMTDRFELAINILNLLNNRKYKSIMTIQI